FVYPNAAEELTEGKVYAWQIQAISLTSGGAERFPSELLWFTVENVDDALSNDDVESPAYSRIEIEPLEAKVAPGGSIMFGATVFDAENVPAFDVRPTWSVVPSSKGTVDENGVFVAGDEDGVVAVVAEIGALEQFATVEVGEVAPEAATEDQVASGPPLQLLSPIDGQMVMEAAPSFAWNDASEDSAAASYRIGLRRSQDGAGDYESAQLLWEAVVPASQTSMAYPATEETLESGETYFVRIAALDSTEEVIDRSPVTSFTTMFEDKLSYELQRAWEDARLDGVDSIAVRLLLKVDGIVGTSLMEDVEAAGATIELVEGPWIQILIPFTRLNELAALDLVDVIALPAPHEYLAAPGLAHGDAFTRWPLSKRSFDASQFSPVDIAVFEFGFDPVAIKEMLPNVDIRYHSFRADKRIEGSGGADTRHGAAVVRALAEYLPPNATLHLVNFDTEPEFHRALDNVVHQLDVDVITCSVSWANAYDHYDGTSYFSRRVEQILSTDTPLVVAAGNFAQSHWQSDYNDSNTNGIHNFDPSA
ncbi:MAG: hypothetical protein R3282_09955, partial [Rhodothermales bacterium]|nr:hypothetical protein [Rhodothermales bacterium]